MSLIEKPSACYKYEIYNCTKLSRKIVSIEIHKVLMSNRKIKLEEAKKIKQLFKNETIEVLKNIGEI